MDGTRFDGIARALASGITRRGALGAIAGMLAAGAARNAHAGRKRSRCRPDCAPGQTCRRGACACDDGGAVCGAQCCRSGQECAGGQCVEPPPDCRTLAEPCGNGGRPCCDGLTCASGQGGQDDVACHVPAGGACASTADCVYFAECEGGVCIDHQPVPCTVCARGCRFSTIEAAVAAAAPGDVVTIAPGDYAPAMTTEPFENLVIGIGLKITRPLTLAACAPGGGVTISCSAPAGAYASVCIGVLDADATFERLNLVGPGLTRNVTGFAIQGGATAQPTVTTIRDCSARAFTIGLSPRNGGTALIDGGLSIADATWGLGAGPGGGAVVCAVPVTFSNVVTSNCLGDFPGCGC